ncbi:MAG: M20 family metallopeptidase [Verrucomicrobiales bacterium]|nr:M20 family metallopeptidase [Verrucomicrobiales bacterium]
MDVVSILSDLVRINSVNPEWNGPGEAQVAGYVRQFFEDRHFDVWVDEVLPGRPNVYIRVPGKHPSRRLVLEAHMDTVSVAGMVIPPFEPTIKDGKLYGRGSVDVKSGLAGMMYAVSEVKDPNSEIWLAAVIDEEHAYRGVLGLIDQLPGADACIVAEPTENRIVRANKGVLRWKIRTLGKAAHSAMPHLGKNAIYEMAKVISRIEKDNERLAGTVHPLVGPATCSVGTISGGTQVNIVPEHCEIRLDRRLLPGEKADEVLSDYKELLADLEVEMLPPDLIDEAMETPEDAGIVSVSRSVLEKLSGNPEPIGVPYGCDVTKLSRAGIPGIIFGPGSIEQAHGAIEYVEIDQLERAAQFYTEMIRSF